MACYELVPVTIPSVAQDIGWHHGDRSVWFKWSQVGAPHLARIDLTDGTTLDSFDPPVTANHDDASPIAVDDSGNVWWAETATHSSVSVGVRVHRYNPATDVDTVMASFTSTGAPDGLNHDVSGLEWHAGRIWVAWGSTRALPVGRQWALSSFLEDGSDVDHHLSGADTTAPLADGAAGPLVFDPDGVSLWFRFTSAGVSTIAHLDIRDDTLTIDPAGGTEDSSLPGVPTEDGLLFSSFVDGAWRVLRFDDPGFTLTDSGCDDTVPIWAVAYDGAGDSAFIDMDGFDLWRRIVQVRRFWLGKVGFRG